MIKLSKRDFHRLNPQTVTYKICQSCNTAELSRKGVEMCLSMSHDIEKVHGGELKVETRENEGSIFTIMLPATN
jgi:K+-sensing histidine kinase KdpD